MQSIEIIVMILAVAIVASVLGRWIYKKMHHKPTGECACCQARMKKAFKKIKI